MLGKKKSKIKYIFDDEIENPKMLEIGDNQPTADNLTGQKMAQNINQRRKLRQASVPDIMMPGMSALIGCS